MASKGIGAKVFIDGEKEFKSAITEINRGIKTLGTELNKVSSDFLGNEKSMEAYTAKNKVLEKQVESQTDKLKTQKEALANAIIEYGEGSKQVENWRQSIFRTETEINKLNHQINQNEKAMDDASNSTDDLSDSMRDLDKDTKGTSGSVIKLGDMIKAHLISAAIIGGVKALGSAMKSVVNGVVDLGKQSVMGYAEFEQLVGGVDTLFKESSQKVQDYANNAFKTTGLGANEYMEIVTGFSASLLQGLGGDTNKAADVANMAMIDMADNANKMGTDMASIQNAYGGFAKQNYTMLDNLKLGYGGTKTEMERLLKDAQKFSGVKYNINNLNDVYQAIHVIQNEMGITGTTALEAEETISGSLNAMKSAFSNLIVGLSDGNADLDQLITNVIDGFMSVVDNMMPVINKFLTSLVAVVPEFMEFLVQYLPDILDIGMDMLKSLAEGILDAVPQLIDTALILINQLAQTLIEMLPTIIQVGIEMIVSLITGIAQSIPTLIPTIVETVLFIVETLLDNIDMLVDAGIELIIALALGLIDAIPILIEKTPIIVDKLVSALIRNAPKLLEGAVTLMVEIGKGLIKGVPQVLSTIPKIVTTMKDAILNTNWLQVGKDIIKGIADGVGKMKDVAVEAVKNVGSNMMKGIKGFFGIKSPSRKMRDEVGAMLAKGLGIGFEDEMDSLSDSMYDAVPTDFSMSGTVRAGVSGSNQMQELIEINRMMLAKNTDLLLDGDLLVGGTGNRMDRFMMNKLELAERGV